MKFRDATIGKMRIKQSFDRDELIEDINFLVGENGKIIDLQYSTVTAMNGKTLYTVFLILE